MAFLLGTWVYRTGPFGQNPNYGRYFNDGYAARNPITPRTFHEIKTTLFYKDTDADNVCVAISTTYGSSPGTTTIHRNPPLVTDATTTGWNNPIRVIKGCSSNRINKVSYSDQQDGKNAKTCGEEGTKAKGQAFNAYPFQFDPHRCTYVYWSGKTVKFNTDGKEYLTDVYFYWKC